MHFWDENYSQMHFPAFWKTSLAQRCLYTCLPWVSVPLKNRSISFAQQPLNGLQWPFALSKEN